MKVKVAVVGDVTMDRSQTIRGKLAGEGDAGAQLNFRIDRPYSGIDDNVKLQVRVQEAEQMKAQFGIEIEIENVEALIEKAEQLWKADDEAKAFSRKVELRTKWNKSPLHSLHSMLIGRYPETKFNYPTAEAYANSDGRNLIIQLPEDVVVYWYNDKFVAERHCDTITRATKLNTVMERIASYYTSRRNKQDREQQEKEHKAKKVALVKETFKEINVTVENEWHRGYYSYSRGYYTEHFCLHVEGSDNYLNINVVESSSPDCPLFSLKGNNAKLTADQVKAIYKIITEAK